MFACTVGIVNNPEVAVPRDVRESVVAALHPVIADLARSGIVQGRLGAVTWLDTWLANPETVEVEVCLSSESSVSFALSLRLSSSELVSIVASQLQDFVIDQLLAGGSDTNWPRCFKHPRSHPMNPVVLSDLAYWSCPDERARLVDGFSMLVRIGELVAGPAS